LNAYVIMGNYRNTYYRMHQPFFDDLAEKEVFSKFAEEKPLILYAPTCHDLEHTTSFLTCQTILENLPDEYNMLVKIHPEIEETDAPTLYRIMGQFEKKKNIRFVQDFSIIFPLLNKAAMYIGDMSSIGYDYLWFNRPMFFLNQQKRDSQEDRRAFLYR